MPKNPKESEIGAEMMRRGFEKIDLEAALAGNKQNVRGLSKNERRKLTANNRGRWFNQFSVDDKVVIVATDDIGQTWLGESAEGLEELGFVDFTGTADSLQRDKLRKSMH